MRFLRILLRHSTERREREGERERERERERDRERVIDNNFHRRDACILASGSLNDELNKPTHLSPPLIMTTRDPAIESITRILAVSILARIAREQALVF